MSKNSAAGGSSCTFSVSSDRLLRLAVQLHGLGPEFEVWADIDDLPPDDGRPRSTLGLPKNYRPAKKPPQAWTWFDCHRSVHYGVAKFGIEPTKEFNDTLLSLARGDWHVLPPAADLLEAIAAGATCVGPLLAVMREVR